MHPIQSDQPQGKLQFKAFREHHFGPDKVYHWNSLFFPNGNQWRSAPQDVQQQHISQNHTKRRPREVENENKINKRTRIKEESRKISKRNESKLSEQAIEIFRFSEAWKRESKAVLRAMYNFEGTTNGLHGLHLTIQKLNGWLNKRRTMAWKRKQYFLNHQLHIWMELSHQRHLSFSPIRSQSIYHQIPTRWNISLTSRIPRVVLKTPFFGQFCRCVYDRLYTILLRKK
jgi:hypothetical protein